MECFEMLTVDSSRDRGGRTRRAIPHAVFIAASIVLLAGGAGAHRPPAACAESGMDLVSAKVTETLVAPWDKRLEDPVMSADGLHFGYAISVEQNSAAVAHDDKLYEGFTRILGPVSLSPDGLHIAYWAAEKKKARFFLDREPGGLWDAVVESPVVWSADGTRYAYLAGVGRKAAVVVDGKVAGTWDDLDPTTLRISPDGKHYCYTAYKNKKQVVVADGVVGTPYDSIDPSGPIYNPTGDRLAYLAADGDRSFAVVNGVPDSAFDEVTVRIIAWSPDGKHLAYSARRGDRWWLRIDGRPGPGYRAITPPVFSADGNHIAFWAVDGGSPKDTARRVLVRDGVVVGNEPALAGLTLSADGARIAYLRQVGTEWRVVVDGVPDPPFEGVRRNFPEFSADGRHVAYVALKGGRWHLVIDGVVRAVHDKIGTLRPGAILGRGEGHLSYAAADGAKWKVVHDGGVGPEYDRILEGGPTVLADGTAAYLAVRGAQVFRVRQEAGGR